MNRAKLATQGMVAVRLHSTWIPVALKGLQVNSMDSELSLTYNNIEFSHFVSTSYIRNDLPCLANNFSAAEYFQFIDSDTFIKSFIKSTEHFLPIWLRIRDSTIDKVQATNQHSKVLYGHEIESEFACSGAPVIGDRLYSVFTFASYNIDFDLFGKEPITLSTSLSKICLITGDTSTDLSTFLLFPEDYHLDLSLHPILQNILSRFGFAVVPRGIAVSSGKGVKLNHDTSELEFWNGDHFFTYK